MYFLETPSNQSLRVETISDKCIIWSTIQNNSLIMQILLCCEQGSLQLFEMADGLIGYAERYPASKDCQGHFYYIALVDKFIEFELELYRLQTADKLRSFNGGPAVIDMPICNFGEICNTINYEQHVGASKSKYISHLRDEDFYALYKLGLAQAQLFPDCLKQELDWYMRAIVKAYNTYARLTKRASCN